jgi:transposase InsO family protein
MAMLRSDYPVAVVCQVLGLARSTAYYQAHSVDDQPLRQAITEVAEQYPTYGTRRMAKQLGRAPYRLTVNRKRARRVMRELGLLRVGRPRQRRTTNSQHPFGRFPNLVSDRVAQAPDEIWVSDITYVRLHTGFIENGDHYGRLHANNPRMASRTFTRSGLDADRAPARPGDAHAPHSSQRPGHSVRRATVCPDAP